MPLLADTYGLTYGYCLNRQITNMCIANRLPMLSQPTVIDWHSTNTRITVKWHLANISTESWPTPTTDIVTNMLTDSWQRCWLTPPIYNLEDTWSISFSEKNCICLNNSAHYIYITWLPFHRNLHLKIKQWKGYCTENLGGICLVWITLTCLTAIHEFYLM